MRGGGLEAILHWRCSDGHGNHEDLRVLTFVRSVTFVVQTVFVTVVVSAG